MTSTSIKRIAIITMIIDHTGAFIFNNYIIFRMIGRLAFPLFAFLIGEGVRHTKNVKKYMLRLFIFAIISEIPFDLVRTGQWLDWSHQNIFFTLTLGVIAIKCFQYTDKRFPYGSFISVFAIAVIAEYLQVDYGMFGILMIFVAGYGRTNESRAYYIAGMNLLFAVLLFFGNPLSAIQAIGSFSLIFMMLYNGEKGKGIKYLFYSIYPLHLLAIYLLNLYILG